MRNNLTTTNLSRCYKVLKVSPNVKWEVVKKSYHSLAKRYHPDLNPRNRAYEEKIKELTRAFKVLESHYRYQEKEDAGKRTASPEEEALKAIESLNFLSVKEETIQAIPVETVSPEPDFGLSKSQENDWKTKFQTALHKLEKKWFLLDVQKNVRVDPATAVHGGTIRMRSRKESFLVKIPSGSWTRMVLRIAEKGESSLFGRKRGDLLLNIQVVRSNQIDPGELMFYYEMKVSREQIKNSRVMTLESVHGPIKFVLPRNTREGQNFVLKSKPKSNASASSSSHVVTIRLT